jgi:hypothetical protein
MYPGDDALTPCYWNVAIAFWRQTAADLAAGDTQAWAWLSSPGFDHWAQIVDIDSDVLRERLRETYGNGHRRVSSRRAVPWS